MRTAYFIMVISGLLLSNPARAQDSKWASALDKVWRFCVAADFDSHVGYLTIVFSSAADKSDLEAGVSRLLIQRGYRFEGVQCPLPASKFVADDRHETAFKFLKSMNFEIVSISG